MVNNNNNTPDENNNNPEVWENQEELKKKQKSKKFDYQKPITEFINHQTKSNLFSFDEFTENKIDSYYQDFILYLKESTVSDKDLIENFEKEKLNHIENFKKLVLETSTHVKINYQNSINEFRREFDFSLDEIAELERLLKLQSLDRLQEFSKNHVSRFNFILENSNVNTKLKDVKSKKQTKKFEEIYLGQNIEQTLINSNLPDEQKKKIKDALYNVVYKKQLDFDDFWELLKLFNDDWKKAILKYFVPSISLKTLIDYSLIDKDKSFELFWDIIKKQYWFNLTLEQEKFLYWKLDLNNIIIETEELGKELWDSFFMNLLNSEKTVYIIMNAFDQEKIREMQSEIKSEAEFIDAVMKNSKISNDIKNNFHKLISWNYLKLRNKSLWNEDIVIPDYFYIWDVKSKVELYSLTKNWNIINDYKTAENETRSYFEMIELFEIVSDANNYEVWILNPLEYKNEINNLTNWTNSKTKLVSWKKSINSPETLKNYLDLIDPDWEKVNLRDMVISFKDDNWVDDVELYVVWITPQWVKLNDNEIYPFDYFAKVFEKREAKRKKIIKTPQEFLDNFWKINKNFENYIFKDWKIMPKSEENNSDYEWIEYFVWNNWKAINIENVWNWNIDFTYWKFVEWNVEKEKYSQYTSEEFAQNWSYQDLYLKLKTLDWDHKFTPKLKNNIKKDEKENVKNFKRSKSLLKTYLSFWSVSELVTWIKHITWSIESYFKTWNALKAAQLAKLMWWVLPQSILDELEVKLESEEKKSMETKITNLKQKNSWAMIKAIEDILKSSSSQQYEIEAALMTMVSKFWTLYAKWMWKHRGSYIWYRALWWKPNDEFFMKIKQRCEEQALIAAWDKKNQPIPFTEEYLIEMFLGEQVKPESKYCPKRRNKFDKDYWNYLNKWAKEELEDWAIKTWNQVTFKWRYDYVLDELKNGTYNNWVWWIKNVWWKAWDSVQANAIPFVLTYSWIAKNFTQPLLKEVTWDWMWRNTPYTTLMFNKSADNISVYQKAVQEVVKSFWDSDMEAEFKSAWKDIQKISDFWFKYWNKLNARLTFRDWFIYWYLKWKDAKLDRNTLKSYYEYINWIQNDAEFDLKPDFIKEWKVSFKGWWTPVTLTWWNKLVQKYIQFPQWYCTSEWKKLINDIVSQINDLKDPKNTMSIEYKKSCFKELYTLVHASVLAQWENYKKVLQTNQLEFLKNNGLDMSKFWPEMKKTYPWNVNDEFRWYAQSKEFQAHLNREFENLFINNNNSLNNVSSNVLNIKTSIDKILNSQHSQQNNINQKYKKAA